jgi:hypothetical protein
MEHGQDLTQPGRLVVIARTGMLERAANQAQKRAVNTIRDSKNVGHFAGVCDTDVGLSPKRFLCRPASSSSQETGAAAPQCSLPYVFGFVSAAILLTCCCVLRSF